MKTQVVTKDHRLPPFVRKCGHYGGLGAGSLLTYYSLISQGQGHWMQRLRGRKTHMAGRNWEARHGFFIPLLPGSFYLGSSFFRKGTFLDICRNILLRTKGYWGSTISSMSCGLLKEGSWDGGTSTKGRREKTLLSLIWTVYPSPKMIQISHYWIMQKQLFYLRSLLCFLNLFSAQPNELSELSDSSKEWQMSRLCCCCCYFARNTWCV